MKNFKLFLAVLFCLILYSSGPAFAGACYFGGDSITAIRSGYVTAAQTYSHLIAEYAGCDEVNNAVGGENSTQIKNRLDTYLASNSPEYVSIMPGHNDADIGQSTAVTPANFESNLRHMIEASLAKGAKVRIFTPPTTTHSNIRANLPAYLDIIRKMPKYYPGVVVIDVHRAFAELGMRDASTLAGYFIDLEHIYPSGHTAIFNLVTTSPEYGAVFPESPEECAEGGGEEEPSAGVQISYVGGWVSNADQSSYTTSSFSLKTDPSQKILVTIGGFAVSTKTLSSVTVGGVSASVVSESPSCSATSSNDFCSIIALADGAIPSSGSVVVSWSGTFRYTQVGVYRMTGNASNTPTDTLNDASFSGTVLSGTLDVPAGGAALGYVHAMGSSGTVTTWTGLTEDFDDNQSDPAGAMSNSGAHAEFATAQTGLTVSGSVAGSGLWAGRLAAASWGP